MNKNAAAAIATAFTTYNELAAACARGYVPSLRAGASDDLPTRTRKGPLLDAASLLGVNHECW